MTPDSQPPLPRRPDDPENLARLREEARRRRDRDERPPAPVYGGAPMVNRRWTMRGIVLLVLGALAAFAAILTWLWPLRRPPGPVYGGPPLPVPPVPPIQAEPHPEFNPNPSLDPAARPPEPPRPAATVYGGPPPPQRKQ